MAAIYGYVELRPLASSSTIRNESLVASCTLAPLEGTAAIESQEAIRLELQPIEVAATLLGGGVLEGSGTLAPLASDGNIKVGRIITGAVTLRPLEMDANATRFDAAFNFTLEPLEVAATIFAGNRITSALRLTPLTSAGLFHPIGALSAALELRPLVTEATFTQDTLIRIAAQLKELTLAAQLYSGNVFSAQLTLPILEVDGTLHPESRLTASLTLPLLLLESTFGVPLPLTAEGYAGLSLNLNDIRALSRYDGLPFNSFAQFNGVYLAAGAGGIFALAGDSDGAAAIDAVVRSGLIDFGSNELKRIRAGYINYRTDGDLILKLTTDEGESYEYTIERVDGDGIHSNRIKVGRGMVGRHFQWEIRNRDGAHFEINDLTLLPMTLPRKFK